MKKLPLFDLHCDTATAAFDSGKSLISNDLQLSLDRLSGYETFCQVLAVWSSDRLDPEAAWQKFFKVRDSIVSELSGTERVRLVTSGAELSACENDGVGAVILAVEGGKLIENDLSRLDTLYRCGVRFLTLTWNDPCPICGSCLTEDGLSDFGYEVIEKCSRLGIVPDISHASDRSALDVIEYCEEHGVTPAATHSNSRTALFHERNLPDGIFSRMVKLGAAVGISLAPQHLGKNGAADVKTVFGHIEHYLSLGGENTVCLGCDLDGIDKTPDGISSVSDLYAIADEMAHHGCGDELIEKIFYKNARDFILRNLK